MKWLIRLLTFLLFLFSACASSRTLQKDYSRTQITRDVRSQTTVFFLVDGLSSSMLQHHFRFTPKSSLKNFFLRGKTSFAQAHTVFPSLTYPAISSLLVQAPIDHHPIIGNKIKEDLDFTQPSHHPQLNALLEGRTVFSRFAQAGRPSVSLSYAFGKDANATLRSNLQTGLEYLHRDYQTIDQRTIDSLTYLLKRTPSGVQPQFIFVHLIGVDALAHRYGPYSLEVLNYLATLQSILKPAFDLLLDMESQGRVPVTFLSADHGFEAIRATFDLEKLGINAEIINQGRVASLHFGGKNANAFQSGIIPRLLSSPAIEMVAQRKDDLLTLFSRSNTFELQYLRANCGDFTFAIRVRSQIQGLTPPLCPQDLDRVVQGFPNPKGLMNLAAYFHSPEHPQAVILASRGVSFESKNSDEVKGDHGGLTTEEVLVPFLMRNASLLKPEEIPAIYRLLDSL